jgi:hypothetical protein
MSEHRLHACKALLDLLRRGLAIKVDYLDTIYQEGMKQRSSQQLAVPWAIDETERMTHNSSAAFPGYFGGLCFVAGHKLSRAESGG